MPVQEQYREANDRVRVPEELLRRTEAAVSRKRRNGKYMYSGGMPLWLLPPASAWYALALEFLSEGPDHCTGRGDQRR